MQGIVTTSLTKSIKGKIVVLAYLFITLNNLRT
jgi:hypothetical protein